MFHTFFLIPFINSALKYPKQNAFLINEKYYTYAQFTKRIIAIANSLEDNDEVSIALITNDDIDTYASIFAIWITGKIYVPINPNSPSERNRNVLEQVGVKTILDSTKTKELNSIDFETSIKYLQRYSLNSYFDDQIAYILFTSGSTGKPKGVQISFNNLTSFIKGFLNTGFKLDHTDRCLQCFDLTFDVSIQSFVIPLMHGACVYTVPHDQIKYSYVFGLLDDHELTFGIFAPSMIRLLKPYFDEIDLPKLRYCILTAEASPIDLVKEWAVCIPNARIFNFYGPTEATIYCIYYEVKLSEKIKEANGILAIGKPFKGVNAVILDEHLKQVDKGVKGEMYISGNQVTAGYWNNPERNDEAFAVLDCNGSPQRFYKTGDLCMNDNDGDILYYGRLDNQVKIQGFRIELGEIEFHARASIGGKNAVAFIYQGQTGSNEIALCLETNIINKNAIFTALKAKLPSYMKPAKIYYLDKFPLNTSDKVDKKEIAKRLNLSL
ncbi:amino acid adenylation domain-containing protein [Winogradskyella sp.]|nr:amino acid adenylation domain-containing protein [Winogradskyella sp.]